MRVLLIFCVLLVVALANPKPNVRFKFERAREKLYSIPPPEHDNGLAQRVSDCISGKIRDHELCSGSVVKFTKHIQDMYIRSSAIYQAEEAGRMAIAQAEKEAEKQKVTQTARPIDVTPPDA